MLRLTPDSIIVLRMEELLSVEQATRVREQLARVLPGGTKVLVLDGGKEMAIMEPSRPWWKLWKVRT